MKGGDFMKNLRKIRKQAGITQKRLAKILGVSKATVCRWELEPDRYPSGRMLPIIAKALNCEVKDFYA